jgi:hypothetical protein
MAPAAGLTIRLMRMPRAHGGELFCVGSTRLCSINSSGCAASKSGSTEVRPPRQRRRFAWGLAGQGDNRARQRHDTHAPNRPAPQLA